jgi:hypothetical protein
VLRLREQLARVDALLDDPVIVVAFMPLFDPRVEPWFGSRLRRSSGDRARH